jgi:hypothetical protein
MLKPAGMKDRCLFFLAVPQITQMYLFSICVDLRDLRACIIALNI